MNMLEVLLIIGPALWYVVGVRHLWRRAGLGRGVPVWRALCFGGATITLIVALLSPLDEMAEAVFSMHMVQHLLLILVAAPLFALSAPVLPLLSALPATLRRRIGRWWLHRRAARGAVHILTNGVAVFVLHLVGLWFWHFPLPYRAALARPAMHALEHLSFLGTALLLWWVVIAPMGRRRLSEGGAIVLVGLTLMQSGVLGAALVFARAPWYPMHEAATRAMGRTLLADQQLAGLLMWIPAGAVYVAAVAWLFLSWIRRDEQRTGDATRVDRGTQSSVDIPEAA